MSHRNKCSEGLGGGNLKLMEISKPLKEEENYLKSLVERKEKKDLYGRLISSSRKSFAFAILTFSTGTQRSAQRHVLPSLPQMHRTEVLSSRVGSHRSARKNQGKEEYKSSPKRNLLIYTPDSLLRLYTREIKWQWLSDSPVCHLLPAKAENSHRTFYFVTCPFKWLRNTPLRLGKDLDYSNPKLFSSIP